MNYYAKIQWQSSFLGPLFIFLHTERQNGSVGTNNRHSNSHPTESPEGNTVTYTQPLAHRAQSVNGSSYQYILVLSFTMLAGVKQRDAETGGVGGQLDEQGIPLCHSWAALHRVLSTLD